MREPQSSDPTAGWCVLWQGDKVDLLAEGDDDGDRGFAVGGLRTGSELHYPNINIGPASRAADEKIELELTLYLASAAASGSATVLASNAAGRLLGSADVAPTGSWTSYRRLSMALQMPRSALDADGDLDLVLSLDSSVEQQQPEGELARLKHFTLRHV